MVPVRSILALLVIVWSCEVIYTQSSDTLLGVRMRTEVFLIAKEIEARSGKPIHADFYQLPESQLGSSYIDDDSGEAFLIVDPGLRTDKNKLEAVIAHELLHLK